MNELLIQFPAWFRDVDFEIIVVDDGSPDGTQEVVKQLQQVYGEDRIVSTIDLKLDMYFFVGQCLCLFWTYDSEIFPFFNDAAFES